jgi:hypothetical protein
MVDAVKLLGKRLLILGTLATAFAIGSDLWQEAMPKVNPPPTAAEWKLSAPLDCGRPVKAEMQSWPETSGARRVCRAKYAGPLTVRLTLFDMTNLDVVSGSHQVALAQGIVTRLRPNLPRFLP